MTSTSNYIQQESHKVQEAAEPQSKPATIPLPQQLIQQSSSSAFTPKFNKKTGVQNASETSKHRLIQAESTLVKQGSFLDQNQNKLALLRHASS